MSKTGEIRFADGRIHRCVFGLSDWVSTTDPPWEQGVDGLFHPLPDVEYTRVVRNISTGEILTEDEWLKRES